MRPEEALPAASASTCPPEDSSAGAELPKASSHPVASPYLTAEVVKQAAKDKLVVLVPCTFEDDREASAARQLMPSLKAGAAPARVLMVQLFLPGAGPGPKTNELLLRRHEAMLAAMPHAVLVNP